MNKTILVLVALAFFPSCARTYIREWKDGEVTICGNKWASNEKLAQDAAEKCGTPSVTAIGGGTVDSGAQSQVIFGTLYTTNTREDCTRFRCDGGHVPASK